MNSKDFIALEEEYGAHNYHPLDVVIERAEGVWVYDVDGKRYLDCLSAYSAVNQGHVHPQILNALLEQARKVTLTSRQTLKGMSRLGSPLMRRGQGAILSDALDGIDRALVGAEDDA